MSTSPESGFWFTAHTSFTRTNKCSWSLVQGQLNACLPTISWGYRGSSPTAFRPGKPAFCGSHPLGTPYYCRLGYLLCLFAYPLFVYYFVVYAYVYFVFFGGLFSFVAFSFSTLILLVGFWPVKTVGHIIYIVLVQTLNHAQSIKTDNHQLN